MHNIDEFQLQLGAAAELVLVASLALMMFSVALSLRVEHFSFIRTQPRIYVGGVAGQIIGLPLLTLLLCIIFEPAASIALGMILVACCPGGNVSNLLVFWARGDTALSVSLTAASSLLAALFTPLSIVFWSGLYPPTAKLLDSIDFDRIDFLLQTAVLLLVPLLLGMYTNSKWSNVAQQLQKPLATLAGLMLFSTILSAFINNLDYFLTLGLSLVGLLILHNASAFAFGNGLARFLGAQRRQRISLTIELGIQNSGLAIVILLTQLQELGGTIVVAGFWGTWHIIVGLLLVIGFRWQCRT